MNLIISSKADSASINLRDRLLEMSKWKECGKFKGNRVWKFCEPQVTIVVKGHA